MPRLSVVIPCHDLGAFLDEAVASCLLQTFEDFEILIVDDGSTDPATCALLDDYRRPKTRLVRTANRGLAKTRNTGAVETTGELLCFLDADDRLHPTFFEKAIAALDTDPALAFAGCWIEAFGDETWTYRPTVCDLPTVLAECTVATPALVRRAAFDAVGGFDEGMPAQGDEDWDFWIHLLVEGFRGTILPEVLFEYRRRRGSMVEDCYYTDTHLELMEYLFRKYAAHYEKYLDAVLELKRREIDEHRENLSHLEEHLRGDLEPRLAAMRHEALGATKLESELDAARFEIRALRASWSWRLTAPLRRVVDLGRVLFGRGDVS